MIERISSNLSREISRTLEGLQFPAERFTVINHAEYHNAPKETLEVLDELPNREFKNPSDVLSALRGVGFA
jgi:hypothetical protein